MSVRPDRTAFGLVALLLGACMVLAGCNNAADDAGTTGANDNASSVDGTTPVSGDLSPETAALLAGADALDGKTDHHVEKCYACSLGMSGKPELSAKLGDYTLDFCSEACRTHFNADPEKLVKATKIPEAGGGE